MEMADSGISSASQKGASILSRDSGGFAGARLTGMNVAVVAITILVVSIVGATLWAKRSGSGTQREAKILLFALYFWILVFLQAILAAIGYSVLTG
jgi:hypothetical protein